MSNEPGKDEQEIPAGGGNAFDKCFANLWETAKNPAAAEEYLDVLEQDIYDLNPRLLDTLLQDKTTGGYILWACDEYAANGEAYAADREMTPDLIIGKHTTLIQPRVAKSREEQRKRTRKSAEVFSPAWLCNEMAGLCDEEWFGRKDVFNAPSPDHSWQVAPAPIRFPSGKTWLGYVGRTCLELACGEAPFLVSRYDAASGAFIPVEKRVGLLDRKLRVIGERVRTEKSWFRHALRAFKSTYGYEYQGDNLLLARENLLWSFVDYYRARWQHAPSMSQLLKVADIIAWNIWQMDGLTDSVPFAQTDASQLDLFLFADRDALSPSARCKIRLWPLRKNFYLKQLKGTPSMKFDVVIGNPPYQLETSQGSLTNGQTSRKNIFHYFQMQADNFAREISVLIYPGGRWIQRAGKGMKEFGLQQINDISLKTLCFYPKASEVFPSSAAQINDGISIVVKKFQKDYPQFDYCYCVGNSKLCVKMQPPGDDVFPLNPNDFSVTDKIEKFRSRYGLPYLHDAVLSRSLFGIESDFVEKNTNLVRRLQDDEPINWKKEIKLFTNDKAGSAGRTMWFVAPLSIIKNGVDYINKWKVVVLSANAGGQRRNWQLQILDNHSVFGRSRVALSAFNSKKEADNFYKYVSSTVIRYAFLLTDEALSTLAQKVPDLQDYTSNNKLIDFSQNIDEQLKKMMSISESEFAYMRDKLENNRKN